MKNFILLLILLFSTHFGFAQTSETAEQEIKRLSHDWMIAAMKRDEKTLNKIVATEFTLGGSLPDNPSIPRDLWMMNTMQHLTIDSINYNSIQVVRIENIAIVKSVFYWSVAFDKSPPQKDTVSLIDTWIKRDQHWQVVNRIVVDK